MSDSQPAPALMELYSDRESWVYRHAGAAEERILRHDGEATMHQANNRPGLLAITQAEGVRVCDASGRQYLDLHGNNCHHIGYGHAKLVTALTRQLGSLTCNVRGFTNEAFVDFAGKLISLWPGQDGRVFMVPGGAAAVELALVIARVHTGRHKSLTFTDGFHGRSLGAISVTGAELHRSERLGPLLPGALYLPSFRPGANGASTVEEAARHSLEAAQHLFETERDIACFLAEPMALDAHRPPAWYWPAIRRLCDEHKALLIFDEVPTGLGKMGSLFNSENFDVRPDMTVLGKALGGAALPVACVIADGRLDSAPELNLGYFTHEKNPLMALAALTTLNIIVEDGLINSARRICTLALDRFELVRQRFPGLIPQRARAQGGMLSFDIAQHSCHPTKNPTLAQALFYCCIENGLILNYPAYGTMLTMSFPLVATREDIVESFAILEQSLGKIERLSKL